MEISQVDVIPLSPENLPLRFEFLPACMILSQEKATFLKTSANLSNLYRIPVRIIFNSNKGVKSLEGIINNTSSDAIQIHQLTIPFDSISDIQF